MSKHDDMIERTIEQRDDEAREVEQRDERDGKPSASSLERLALCPGSYTACKGIKETTSGAAERGNRIHAIIAGEKVNNPTADEKAFAAVCGELTDNVVETTLGVPIGDCDEVWREHRLWAVDFRFSGKPDLVAIHGDAALIVDYKTGGGSVADAAGNIQLRGLAVLVKQYSSRKFSSITVCIIQPLAAQRITVCKYLAADLIMATDEVYGIVAAAEDEKAPRTAGRKQCKFCAARTRCPEANAGLATLAASNSLAVMTPEQLSAALDTCEQVESVIEAIRTEAFQRLQFGEKLDGWGIKAGVERESITDSTTVFSRFLALGGTEAAFLTAVTVGKGKLKDKLGELTGNKGKALATQLDTLLQGCVETKTTNPSLAREKGEK